MSMLRQERILSIYFVAMVLGVLTGIVGSLFQLAIRYLDHVWPSTGWISAILSMLMVLLAFVMVRTIAPEASGSGVQEIEGALLHERGIVWQRLLWVKFMGGVLAISAKMVLGREGPTIQMGGNLGEMLGELFGFNQKRRDTLISAGAAAGLAVAFNAPLAGILFVLEEMRNQFNFSFINFKTVAICCVVATMVLHLIMGDEPAILMDVYASPNLSSLGWFFILGLIVGFAGLCFNVVLIQSSKAIEQMKPFARYVFVSLVGLFVGALAFRFPQWVGGGYEIIHSSLTLSLSFSVLMTLVVIRFVLTMLCYGTGVPGGIFAPMLALGTLLGLAFFHVFHAVSGDASVHPGMFAVAAMGALFAAAVRAPITGIVLVVEMTQNYSLILPLMVSCLTATTVMQLAGNPPIYTQLLRQTLARRLKSPAINA